MFYKFQRLYFFLGRFKIPQPFVNLSDSVEPFSDVLKLTFCSLFHTPESSLNSKVRQRILIPALLLVNSISKCKLPSPLGLTFLICKPERIMVLSMETLWGLTERVHVYFQRNRTNRIYRHVRRGFIMRIGSRDYADQDAPQYTICKLVN